jgi:uncharacterized integral membrane protein
VNIKLFSILLIFGLVSVFIVQNAEVVELRLLFWTIAMSRALMFVFLVLIGIACGWLLRGHFSRAAEKRTDDPLN